MPYLMVEMRYPGHLAIKVAEKYFEAIKKFPPDPSLSDGVVPAAINFTTDGIQVLNISLVKEGNLKEAWKRMASHMALFLEIKGFKYSIRVSYTIKEAMETIGIKPPS